MFDRHIISHCCLAVIQVELINHIGTAVPKLWAKPPATNERPRAGDGKQVHRLSSARQLRELSSPLRHTHLLCAGPPVHWSNQHKKKLQLHNYDYIYLSLIRAYNHFFPAWYLLFIFTFLVAPCCRFNQIDLSHTNSLQVQDGPASHWPPFLWKAITTMSVSLPQWLQWDPIYLSCVMFIKLIVNDS